MICKVLPTLAEYFEASYLLQRLVCASPDTLEHYRLAVKHWSAVHPELRMQDVTTRDVAEFQSRVASGRAPATVNSYSRPIKAILRFAADDEEQVLEGAVPRVRMVPERRSTPLALTLPEFGKILAYVGRLGGEVGRYAASEWWTAVLLTAWETGLRMRALLSVRTVDLLWDSGGLYSQADVAKDRETGWYPLQQPTLDAIQVVYKPSRELLFPRVWAISTLGRMFHAILDASGIYAPKGAGMRFHRLRRSKASYTEVAGGVKLYLQDLTAGTDLYVATLNHDLSVLHDSNADFCIGGRAAGSYVWSGLIDEVWFSNTVLPEGQLLIQVPEPTTIVLVVGALLCLAFRRRC